MTRPNDVIVHYLCFSNNIEIASPFRQPTELLVPSGATSSRLVRFSIRNSSTVHCSARIGFGQKFLREVSGPFPFALDEWDRGSIFSFKPPTDFTFDFIAEKDGSSADDPVSSGFSARGLPLVLFAEFRSFDLLRAFLLRGMIVFL